MPVPMAVNARYKHRRVTGVERYAREISLRLVPPAREIAPLFTLPPVLGHMWEQFLLPGRLHANEMLWSPANSAPWILRRQAVTLHDASVFDHPEWFKSAFGAWTRLSWKILCKRAKAILTVSNFSRERLQYHLQIPNEKIYVIQNGVGLPFEPKGTKAINEIRQKCNLSRPYFLFVGTVEPRKNLSMLAEAWQISGLAEQYTLAIAGTKGTVFASVGQIVKSPQGGNLTCRLGYVPDSDLPGLYSGAIAVVVPSLYEGFGLTALEAMACGTPVIASNTTSFPEVVGEAGLLIDPSDPNEIAEVMCAIIENRALADRLREAGLNQAKRFSWDESARRIQKLVESL